MRSSFSEKVNHGMRGVAAPKNVRRALCAVPTCRSESMSSSPASMNQSSWPGLQVVNLASLARYRPSPSKRTAAASPRPSTEICGSGLGRREHRHRRPALIGARTSRGASLKRGLSKMPVESPTRRRSRGPVTSSPPMRSRTLPVASTSSVSSKILDAIRVECGVTAAELRVTARFDLGLAQPFDAVGGDECRQIRARARCAALRAIGPT